MVSEVSYSIYFHSTLISLRCRFPIFSADDGQAHLALLIYVWMVDFGFEANFWWLEWVLGRERDLDPERTFVVGSIFLWGKKNK